MIIYIYLHTFSVDGIVLLYNFAPQSILYIGIMQWRGVIFWLWRYRKKSGTKTVTSTIEDSGNTDGEASLIAKIVNPTFIKIPPTPASP